MRKKILGFLIILSVFACKDRAERKEQTENRSSQKEYKSGTPDENVEEPDNSSIDTSTSRTPHKESRPWANVEGNRYLKTDQQQDTQCNCYCLELDLLGTTELCLVEDEIYINSRFVKSANEVQVFYAGPSERNTNEDLPWDEFDENEPVAVITKGSNGNLELDWKGFTIDGELAVDYAIYGKKTLEGTYAKR